MNVLSRPSGAGSGCGGRASARPSAGRKVGRYGRSLTLLEVIISIALIALLLGSLLTFFWQTLATRDQARRAADRTQLVQQVLERISAELRGCVGVDKINFPLQQFVGERRKITFVTTPLPPADSYNLISEPQLQPDLRDDLREITYELWIDPEETTADGDPLVGGILRTERQAIHPYIPEAEVPQDQDLIYLRHDLWSHELGYLEFRYFDGVEWSTTWNVTEGNPVPQLVQITVGFASLTREELEDQDLHTYPIDQYPLGPDVPNYDRYATIVRLPAADQTFASRFHRLEDEAQESYQFNAGEELPEGEGGPSGPGGLP
jgi:type II secretory pathway pseudopilin PulG